MSDIKQHYKKLYSEFGDDVKSLQWSDRDTQEARFASLVVPVENNESVVDVGCGFSDLYQYLLDQGYSGRYLGLDFIEEFIASASKRFGKDDNASFKLLDIDNGDLPRQHDWYVASGIFNNERQDNESFLKSSIASMFSACNKGVSFNLLSTYVDYQDEGLYYVDPCDIFDFCKRELSQKVVLNHAYQVKPGVIPFEFSIYIYK